MHEQYSARLGVEAPVRGGGESSLTNDEVMQQKKLLSEVIGHSRPTILTAYTGSKRSVKKPKLQWSLNQDSDKKLDDDKDEGVEEEKQVETDLAE